MEFFTTPNSKNIIATLPIVTKEKSALTILLILYFYVFHYISMLIWRWACPMESHLIMPGSHLTRAKWTILARWDRVFFGQFYFCKILIKNMRTFAWMNESNLCPNVFLKALCHCLFYKKFKNLKPLKTTWLKQSSSNDMTNFLIEVRKKTSYEREINIISPR